MAIEAMCAFAGKQQMTFEVAKKAAARKRRHSDHRVAAYHCECGWWHVGGQGPRGGKGRRFRL